MRGGGLSGPPTNLCSDSFKLGGLLGLSFEVSKMSKLMKPLLYGNHDNHSTTKSFFANYCKNVAKIFPISNVSETTILNFETLIFMR